MPEFRVPSPRDRFTASITLGRVAHRGAGGGGDADLEQIERLGSIRGLVGVTATEAGLSWPDDGGTGERVETILQALKKAKLQLTAYGTSLVGNGQIHGRGLTSLDPEVRAFALQQTMRAMDRGAALGAKLFFVHTRAEAVRIRGIEDGVAQEKRLTSALNFLAKYNLDRGYGLRLVLHTETDPGSGAESDLLATRLMIGALKMPDQFAISVVCAPHDRAESLQRSVASGQIAQVDVGNLAGLDIFQAFGIVRTLDQKGWSGDRHLSSRTLGAIARPTDPDAVPGAIRSAMDGYLRLRDRVKAWESDAEVKRLLRQIERHSPDLERLCASFSKAKAETLLGMAFNEDELASHPMPFAELRHRTLQVIYADA